MATRAYGEIDGFPVGATWANRPDLAASRVHRPLQAGICGGEDGAESIVVSGGYIDDEDRGAEIIYTGQGGNHPGTKRQVADQELTRGNVGLVRNQLEGYPVRVIRGAAGDPQWSPASGFRYDGLFRVVDHWHADGKDRFLIWRFRLVSLEDTDAPPADIISPGPAGRIPSVIQRLVRNTDIATSVKKLHDHHCQVCGQRLVTPAGPYAEGAHIRALGRPHDGPDVLGNLLCLCPNDHVLFDAGSIYVDADGIVRDISGAPVGPLRTVPGHGIDAGYLRYHREAHGTTKL
jgi:putative restriction endonuclease